MTKERGGKLETVYFLGFTHFCTRNRKGNFMVGGKTEKTRLKKRIAGLQEEIRIRHWPVKEQTQIINQMLRGHYNYYGLAGNIKSLFKVYEKAIWRRMLSSRSSKSYITWDKFHKIKALFPLLRPKLSIPYEKLKAYAML